MGGGVNHAQKSQLPTKASKPRHKAELSIQLLTKKIEAQKQLMSVTNGMNTLRLSQAEGLDSRVQSRLARSARSGQQRSPAKTFRPPQEQSNQFSQQCQTLSPSVYQASQSLGQGNTFGPAPVNLAHEPFHNFEGALVLAEASKANKTLDGTTEGSEEPE